jgi:hypothetical protein
MTPSIPESDFGGIDREDLLANPEDPRFDHTAPVFLGAALRAVDRGSLSGPPEGGSDAGAGDTAQGEGVGVSSGGIVGRADSPGTTPALTYREILAGANLGFSPEDARTVLEDHASLVFLGRLWDSARRDGVCAGPPRVPPAIWDLADSPTESGQLTAQLLQATGLRVPSDFGQELDFHLSLWAMDAAPVRSAPAAPAGETGADGQAEPPARVGSPGPVWAQARHQAGGVEIEVRSPFPGRFDVEVHWPGGAVAHHATPDIAADTPYVFVVPSPEPTLPNSLRVTRRSRP